MSQPDGNKGNSKTGGEELAMASNLYIFAAFVQWICNEQYIYPRSDKDSRMVCELHLTNSHVIYSCHPQWPALLQHVHSKFNFLEFPLSKISEDGVRSD